MKFLLASICLALSISAIWAFGKQKIAAKGRLLCGTEPAENVRVKLWDDDSGLDPDDELDDKCTDQNGNFHVKGSAFEIGSIEPVLKFYHNCNNFAGLCMRKWRIVIPDKYIDKNEPFDLGTVNLEAELDDEDSECLQLGGC